VALYAELDEKADHLRRADEVKSRFLSNMTHEFRTPVNSIIGLARLLIDDRERAGQPVEPEIAYIRDAAEQLSELVNDLLDLAKVEAGKTVVRPAEFQVSTLFGALRGMLRPLLLNQSVSMVFEDGDDLPMLYTDEGKVSQILRNLISNGLKFTERGEVRITAATENDGTIVFQVRDTGIGIRPEDQSRIFDEFTQVEHRLQRGVRGTGLGLPLSKRLAELLGGTLTVSSETGIGSTFSLRIPMHYRSGRPEAVTWVPEPGKLPLLVVDDAPDAQYLFERTLRNSPFQIYPARTVAQAELALKTIEPVAVILDIMIGNEEAWDVLLRMKRDDRLAHIPVIVISALSDREKAASLGADLYLPKPFDRRILLETLGSLPAKSGAVRVLSIDDDAAIRLLIRRCLSGSQFEVREALSGEDGLAMARSDPPDVVVLDLLMPGLDGWHVLAGLRAEVSTRHVPVVVVTSAALDEDARGRLMSEADALLSKSELTRDTLTRTVRALVAGRGDTRKTAQSI
jgi:CheY-like chemotaxis protein/two-component sensor histidine kinase